MKRSRRTGTLIAAIAMAAISADAMAQKETMLGTWAGTTKSGARAEVAIETIEDSGRVAGTSCAVRPTGHTMGSRLTLVRGQGYDGWDIHVKAGLSLMVYTPQPGGALRQVETYRKRNGTHASATTMLERTETLRCAHLFGNYPRELDAIEGDTGEAPIGYWNGVWTRNGNPKEMMIEHITAAGEALGRICWESRKNVMIGVWDLYPRGPIRTKYDPEHRRLEVRNHTGRKKRFETAYRFVTDSSALVTRKGDVGTPDEYRSAIMMWRGAKNDGCLAKT